MHAPLYLAHELLPVVCPLLCEQYNYRYPVGQLTDKKVLAVDVKGLFLHQTAVVNDNSLPVRAKQYHQGL